MATLGADIEIPIGGPCFLMATLWADKSVWPTKAEKIVQTLRLSAELFFEFESIIWKIWQHGQILDLVDGTVNRGLSKNELNLLKIPKPHILWLVG
jgi:hypothetical protein